MRHIHRVNVPVRAQTGSSQGLCTNVTDELQARFCFVLAFLTEVLVPLVLPFIQSKTSASNGTSTTTTT
ncbi:MAG TPA: hypothetical protein PK379_10975 [Candidatus Hydrogenedentes bacterium]|nr:hypothetical protein [Candidatus Hydrogenedentota bacterium]HOJ70040.1 hypothetical protein [Candidatus Hydrogenedentota bacterium]HOK90536.1 hypothetical protein [Candidatus Hydrogenedentota bacterium]HOV59964.1 hypothetical protein [Candidatus Hydrogenedentota bacterium]